MPSFTTERRVGHTAEEMFALVSDVEKYPLFVPLCERLVILGRKPDGDREVLIADMTVAYKFIRETFTTKVVLDRKAGTIRAEYLDGPFKHLDNVWTFKAVDGGHSTVQRRHGLLINLIVGLIGAWIGAALAAAFNIHFAGFVGSLVVSTVGAIVLLFLLSLLRRA